jgi:hypothetical protein
LTPKILLAVEGEEEQGEKAMKQAIYTLWGDIIRQLFGWGRPRGGKLIITRHTVNRMHEQQLDVDTLEDVFRHGDEGQHGKITRQYASYSVGLYYRYDETENTYVITTCWKGVKRYV